MSDDGGQRPAPTPPSDEQLTRRFTAQFTVPIPGAAAAPPASAGSPAPAGRPVATSTATSTVPAPTPALGHTQVLHVAEPTRPFPPLLRASPPTEARPAPAAPAGSMAPPTTADHIDPLPAQIGVALFWVTLGWWVTVLVRLLGSLVRQGSGPTLLIENIDRWPEETVVAAVLSVLAVLVLLLGRRRGRDALGWASAVLALVTVGVAVWRFLP